MELVKQELNKPLRDEKGRLLPGYSGNPHGRPTGQTLKEFWRQKFKEMNDEQKLAFTQKVGLETIWKMAEGMPPQSTDITSGGEKLAVNIIAYDRDNNSPQLPETN